jgi:hypothetical protein
MNWSKLSILFVIGGLDLISVLVFGKYFSPLTAAIFWAIPFTIIPLVLFLKQEGRDHVYLAKYLRSSTFTLILMFITILSVAFVIERLDNSSSVWIAFAAGALIFLIGSAAFYGIIKLMRWEKHFL